LSTRAGTEVMTPREFFTTGVTGENFGSPPFLCVPCGEDLDLFITREDDGDHRPGTQ
jgi:hypothetical protein